MRGWIIYWQQDLEKNKAFAEYMVSCASKKGMQLEIITRETLRFGIKPVLLKDGIQVEMPEYVINRSRDLRVAEHFEMLGIRVFNSAHVTYICNDKFRTHQFVRKLGIEALQTLLVEGPITKDEAEVIQEQLNYPVVLKTLDGHGGEEVFLLNNPKKLDEKSTELFEKGHQQLLLQKCCNQVGVDVRVFVVGGEIIGAIKRSSTSDFRSNYSLGGGVAWYELNDEQIKKVHTIAQALKSDCVGIDFMIDQQGQFVFNEIEDAVGCRSLYKQSDVDLACAYTDYIYSLMCSSP